MIATPSSRQNLKPHFPSASLSQSPSCEVSTRTGKDTFQTNTTAHFFIGASYLPLLGKRSRRQFRGYTSSILTIAGISNSAARGSFQPFSCVADTIPLLPGVMKGSLSGQFAHASSKVGFLHLSRMLATTLVNTKIRVNIITPRIFPSEVTAGSSGDSRKSELDLQMSNPANIDSSAVN
jgi:NAD(P)-dependent dehydrogenase (short-subunit alcohol dehydrogenase family)